MIRVQALDGGWETIGQDRYPGIQPEDVNPTWNASGPDTLTFTLKRDPKIVHVDLLPFTPVEMYPASGLTQPIWSGYTIQAPPGGGDQPTQVNCQGWQHHRDERSTPWIYGHTDLTAFVDHRNLPTANLTIHGAAGSVQAERGTLLLSWPNPTPVVTGQAVGATIDFGPGMGVRSIIITLQCSNNVGPTFYAIAHDSEEWANDSNPNREDWLNALSQSLVGNGTYLAHSTVTRTHRYVTFLMYYPGAGGTYTVDVWWRVAAVFLCPDASYRNSAPTLDTATWSRLTADTIIKDARDRLCPLLSPTNELITSVSFYIPSTSWREQAATCREIHEVVNDYHGYRLGVDARRRVYFLPPATSPKLSVVTNQMGVQFRDTSSNDGTELYNNVLVRGRDGAGAPLALDRHIADYAAGPFGPSSITHPNTTFASNASNWTGVTYFASIYGDAAGSGELTFSGGRGTAQTTAFSGTFRAGIPYRLRFWWRVDALSQNNRMTVSADFGVLDSTNSRSLPILLAETSPSGFVMYGNEFRTITWVPDRDIAASSVGFRLRMTQVGALTRAWVDAISVQEAPSASMLDRRGRQRSHTLDVGPPTDLDTMDKLAQAFLLSHRSVPFKGTLAITGDVVRDSAGNVVPADQLGLYVGEMIRLLDVDNPDTGEKGRDTTIASVTGLNPAQVALDTERKGLEALMARMAVVQG